MSPENPPCPKCRKGYLLPIRGASTAGWWNCSSCHGLWVERPAVASLGAHSLERLPEAEELDSSADLRAGLCPEGHGILRRVRTPTEEGFFLERCEDCFGIWFDRGELTRLVTAGLEAGLFDFWTGTWQKGQRQKEREENYAAELEERLGPALVQEIRALASRLKDHPDPSLGLGFFLHLIRELSSHRVEDKPTDS